MAPAASDATRRDHVSLTCDSGPAGVLSFGVAAGAGGSRPRFSSSQLKFSFVRTIHPLTDTPPQTRFSTSLVLDTERSDIDYHLLTSIFPTRT